MMQWRVDSLQGSRIGESDHYVFEGDTCLFWVFKYPDFAVTVWPVDPAIDRRTHIGTVQRFARTLESSGLDPHPNHDKIVGNFVYHSPVTLTTEVVPLDDAGLEYSITQQPSSGNFFQARFATLYGDAVYERWSLEKHLYCVASHLQITERISGFMGQTSRYKVAEAPAFEFLKKQYEF